LELLPLNKTIVWGAPKKNRKAPRMSQGAQGETRLKEPETG